MRIRTWTCGLGRAIAYVLERGAECASAADQCRIRRQLCVRVGVIGNKMNFIRHRADQVVELVYRINGDVERAVHVFGTRRSSFAASRSRSSGFSWYQNLQL